MPDAYQDVVHFVRLLTAGKRSDAAAVGRRLLRQVAKERPDLADDVRSLLPGFASSLVRRADQPIDAVPLPVDADSRMELVRRISPSSDAMLHWPAQVQSVLDAVLDERRRESELIAAGLTPSRSMLFVGPPGVGKTVAAHQLASLLGRDLLVLDLAAVMSSFLGKTGINVRSVLDFAARSGEVLLLDEFDAIAKRRDDSSDVGELRRLVNVLLQSIDDWPVDGLLIAATNHPELLDPAVWRRFDVVVEFPRPGVADVRRVLADVLGAHVDAETLDVAAAVLTDRSFAEISREMTRTRRAAVLRGAPVGEVLLQSLAARLRERPLPERLSIANALAARSFSQRRIHDITGLSRDTIRKHARGEAKSNGA